MFSWYKTTDGSRWLLISTCLVLLGGCQIREKPDLAELYQQHGTDHSHTPLVLIHGTMGSKLRFKDTGEEVWPGKINQLIFSNYHHLANAINPEGTAVLAPDIESYDIFDAFSSIGIYDEIIETLTSYGGYQLGDVNDPQLGHRSLYVFHYDWRQDNVASAAQLAAFIEQILTKHSDVEAVDVVAHSMGGLILRYYQRFGSRDVLATLAADQRQDKQSNFQHLSQAHKVRHAIFLGTPQLGSVKSIKRLQRGFDFNLRNIPVEVQVTMPTVYQLLPHPWHPWAVDDAGETLDLDHFDPLFWQQNQWSIYDPEVQQRIIRNAEDEGAGQDQVSRLQHFFVHQLQRAKLFWLSLSPAHEIEHEGFIIMGGDCKDTLNHLVVSQDEQGINLLDSVKLADPHEVRKRQHSWLFRPGDGQVSKASLLGQVHDPVTHQTRKTIHIKYPVFVCEDHLRLTQNLTFQDNLLHVLLYE
ncbi:alpha/beta fold hydrolase [Marinicella meishanensis]|uniref:alpha/beta fold hydrolase n=1 Tax=Marinicella meishanensis TaxID=2873263 RepID=UPI001CBE8FE1|nr:alpha/beta fold hydrolase [Marinicella sp. NBU2979]